MQKLNQQSDSELGFSQVARQRHLPCWHMKLSLLEREKLAMRLGIHGRRGVNRRKAPMGHELSCHRRYMVKLRIRPGEPRLAAGEDCELALNCPDTLDRLLQAGTRRLLRSGQHLLRLVAPDHGSSRTRDRNVTASFQDVRYDIVNTRACRQSRPCTEECTGGQLFPEGSATPESC